MEKGKKYILQQKKVALEEGIKETCFTWAKQIVSLVRKEEDFKDVKEPLKGEMKKYEEMSAEASRLKDKKREYYFKNLSEKSAELFNRLLTYERDMKEVEQMKENIKEYDDYMEKSYEMLEDINKQL